MSQLAPLKYEDVSENSFAGVSCVWDRLQTQSRVTASRDQLSDEASYHASPFYSEIGRELDWDDYVVSIRYHRFTAASSNCRES